MAQQPISRRDDLRRRQAEGYDDPIPGGYLLIGHVPFRDAAGEVAYGTFVSLINGDTPGPPDDHRMWFIGGVPYDISGGALADPAQMQITETMTTDCMFSRKRIDEGQVRTYR